MSKLPTIEGVVIDVLPNTQFIVDLGEGKTVRCYTSGKMRMNKIKVLLNDKVEIVVDEYGHLGRITRRK